MVGIVRRLALPVLGVVAVLHLVAIVSASVNLPYMDEWEALQPGALGGTLDWPWLLRPHNEHRIVPTKLLTWALYKATGWHHVANVVFNFCLYLVELATFIWMQRRILPEKKPTDSACLSQTEFIWCFLGLSGLAWENHSWGFQSQFHFFLLFYFLAIGFAVRNDRFFRLAGVAAVASAFSFSSGVICAVAVAGLLILRALIRATPWRFAAIQTAIIAVGIISWGTGFQKNTGHPDYSWPWTRPFWDHYLSMLGSGWSMPAALKVPVALSVLALLVIHFAIAIPAALSHGQKRQLYGLINLGFAGGGLLATAAVTSLARAGLGADQGASSRYTEFTFFILPLAWTALTHFRGIAPTNTLKKRQVTVIKASFFFLIFWCFAPAFAYTKVYKWHRSQMLAGHACVAGLFAGDLPEHHICDTIYIAPLRSLLDRAVELNLAFTADYRINRGVTP